MKLIPHQELPGVVQIVDSKGNSVCPRCGFAVCSCVKTLRADELSLFADKPKEKECNGQVFRFRASAYRSSTGDIVFKNEFRFQKKLSCQNPKCQSCQALYEDAIECGYKDISWDGTAKDGDLFRLEFTNFHTDWESGIVDDWDLDMVRIEQEVKPIDYE